MPHRIGIDPGGKDWAWGLPKRFRRGRRYIVLMSRMTMTMMMMMMMHQCQWLIKVVCCMETGRQEGEKAEHTKRRSRKGKSGENVGVAVRRCNCLHSGKVLLRTGYSQCTTIHTVRMIQPRCSASSIDKQGSNTSNSPYSTHSINQVTNNIAQHTKLPSPPLPPRITQPARNENRERISASNPMRPSAHGPWSVLSARRRAGPSIRHSMRKKKDLTRVSPEAKFFPF
ncbi:uncharacterized protein BO66DRAFT_237701 [Aspergillus aculeatinus CBS 121060]|uniref:Uncharacterized protein n=1 Tax=Aspergillus aculeatinus CBS 121060 TaxID=1448322 RepID=A0ACD1HIG0_9EURO|nr:hypothetical protein BO66DRAFT_237701 [Aspergillus aculeatinus CBS 121060]RAH73216.1 hypothetical protein BO66DRAFT_237701 [Aspergillus aculeatinus CBS 121060]